MPAAEGPFGLVPWWTVESFADAAISLTYLAIALLVALPALRAKRLHDNRLALTTALIFFTCGVGRALFALDPVFEWRAHLTTGWSDGRASTWWIASWQVVTAMPAIYYLTLRRHYRSLLRTAPTSFDDLRKMGRIAEMEELAVVSAARDEAVAERNSYASMFTAMIHNSHAAIYVKDLQGRYLIANPALAAKVKRTEEEILGQTDETILPDQAALRRANEIRAEQGAFRLDEWVDTFPDGRHYYDAVKFPLYNRAGEVYATCSMALDVTTERRAAAALVQARDAALAATMAKSTFLATMSHEIRTPMNAVIGMTDLLLHTDLTDEQREFGDAVRSSGNALLMVINDILDFSKIESGELVLEASPFSLIDEIESCLDLVVADAARKEVALICDIHPSCPVQVVGDAVHVRQIVANLLSNAVKFTERGEVIVTATARLLPEGRLELTVSVADTGIGIPAEATERLFGSFSQVDPSTTRVYGGTGLGLAISQRLATAMGGSLEVASEPGVGSTFTATLVLEQSLEADPQTDLAAGTSSSLAGRSGLLVDDTVTNLRILERQVEHFGMTCSVRTSPVDALAAVAAGLTYDVAILDMNMDLMAGDDLGRALRSLRPKTPIVLLTSMGHRPAGAGHTFNAFLTKPVKRAVLRDTLLALLSDRASSLDAATTDQLADLLPELRILLAEDNIVNQRVAKLTLEKFGHRVDVVTNGSEAVEAVQQATYDVVLMDVQMPVMDGLEATRRIRLELPASRQPRIVAMTASALIEDRRACELAGMDGYLCKPVRGPQLQAMLADTSVS